MTQVTITFDAPVGEANVNKKVYQLDLAKIPNESLIAIFEYGLQRIVNDKCGGADRTAEEKDKIATATVERIMSGSIADRVRNAAPVNPLDKYIAAIVRDRLSTTSAVDYKKLDTAKAKHEFLMSKYNAQSDEARAKIRTVALEHKKLDEGKALLRVDDLGKL